MKRNTFIFLFIINLFMINNLFAQNSEAFEAEIQGIWKVEKMPFSNEKKVSNANEIFNLHKEAKYLLLSDAISLNVNVNFKDGTSFAGVSLTEVSKENKNEGLLNITWKGDTDKKLLKKYGLTDFILVEKPKQIDGKFRIKLTIISAKAKKTTIEKIKDKDKIMTFECVGI